MKLNKSKFFKPRLPNDYLERSHLINLFKLNKDCSIFTITAPSGYGKSLLASSFIRSIKQSSWLTLSSQQNNVANLIKHIIFAIRECHSSLGEETLQLLNNPNYQNSFFELVESFNFEISKLNEPFYLVLDDYQKVDNKETNQFIKAIFEFHQPYFKIILISRNKTNLPLLQWKIANKAIEFTLDDLKFNQSEISYYIASYNNNLSTEELLKTEAITEGWITGLKIIKLLKLPIQFYSDNNNIQTPLLLKNYITNLLQTFEEPMQILLLVSSFSKEFDNNLYDDLLQLDFIAQKTSFLEFKNLLLNENLFIIPLDNKGGYYRFHHLFKHILTIIAKEKFSKEQIKEINTKIGNWYFTNAEYYNACYYHSFTENYSIAITVFNQARIQYFKNSNWSALENIYNLLNKKPYIKFAELLLTKGWFYVLQGNIEKLNTVFNPILFAIKNSDYNQEEKDKLLGELYTLQAYYHYRVKGDMKTSLKLSLNAIENLKNNNSFASGIAWVFYGGAMQALGNYKSALNRINTEIKENKNPSILTNLYLISCYIYWLEADLNELLSVTDRLVLYAKNTNNNEALANGYYFSGIALYLKNKRKEAKIKLDKYYDIKNNSLFIFQLNGLAALTYCNIEFLSNDEIEQNLSTLKTLAYKNGYLSENNFIKSFTATINWFLYKDPSSTHWALQHDWKPLKPMSDFTSTALQQALILVLSNLPEAYKKAEGLIDDLSKLLHDTNNKLFLTRISIIKVYLLIKTNKINEAKILFNEALVFSQPRGIALPFLLLKEFIPILLNDNLSIQEKNFISTIQKSYSTDIEQLESKISSREKQVLVLIQNNYLNKQIANELFISEKTVKRHIANLYKKIGVSNRKEAIKLAKKLNLTR